MDQRIARLMADHQRAVAGQAHLAYATEDEWQSALEDLPHLSDDDLTGVVDRRAREAYAEQHQG